MTIQDAVGLLDGGPVVVMLLFVIVFGFRSLVNGTVILGKYHDQIVMDKDATIDRLVTENRELLEKERESRELAWRATDVAKYIAKEKSIE